ncbi:Transposase Tc1-like [Trinorchestia longiramus]|nr:Transposase Tc1-like [Trinorchestia longiramus]
MVCPAIEQATKKEEVQGQLVIDDPDFSAKFNGEYWTVKWRWKNDQPVTLRNTVSCYEKTLTGAKKEEFEKEIDRWIAEGILLPWEETVDTGILAMMAVEQPTKNKVRLVLDFRELNTNVACHTGDDVIDCCDETLRKWRRTSENISIVDLKAAYLQLRVDKELWRYQDLGRMFHPRCGHCVSLSNGNKTACRTNPHHEFDRGLVFSLEPIKDNEIFEIKIDRKLNTWSGSVEIGVTVCNPDVIDIPFTATDLRGGTWVLLGHGVLRDGRSVMEAYGCDLDQLVEGDRVGVMRSGHGELEFYVNGESQGVAAVNLPPLLYAVVDMYGKCAQISLTSPVRSPDSNTLEVDSPSAISGSYSGSESNVVPPAAPPTREQEAPQDSSSVPASVSILPCSGASPASRLCSSPQTSRELSQVPEFSSARNAMEERNQLIQLEQITADNRNCTTEASQGAAESRQQGEGGGSRGSGLLDLPVSEEADLLMPLAACSLRNGSDSDGSAEEEEETDAGDKGNEKHHGRSGNSGAARAAPVRDSNIILSNTEQLCRVLNITMESIMSGASGSGTSARTVSSATGASASTTSTRPGCYIPKEPANIAQCDEDICNDSEDGDDDAAHSIVRFNNYGFNSAFVNNTINTIRQSEDHSHRQPIVNGTLTSCDNTEDSNFRSADDQSTSPRTRAQHNSDGQYSVENHDGHQSCAQATLRGNDDCSSICPRSISSNVPSTAAHIPATSNVGSDSSHVAVLLAESNFSQVPCSNPGRRGQVVETRLGQCSPRGQSGGGGATRRSSSGGRRSSASNNSSPYRCGRRSRVPSAAAEGTSNRSGSLNRHRNEVLADTASANSSDGSSSTVPRNLSSDPSGTPVLLSARVRDSSPSSPTRANLQSGRGESQSLFPSLRNDAPVTNAMSSKDYNLAADAGGMVCAVKQTTNDTRSTGMSPGQSVVGNDATGIQPSSEADPASSGGGEGAGGGGGSSCPPPQSSRPLSSGRGAGADRLQFHEKCGMLVRLSNYGRTAERVHPLDEFNNGVVMSNRALRENELFEIRIDRLVDKWSGSIEVGITTHNPATLEFPATMTNLRSGTTMMSGTGILKNGKGMLRQYGDFNLDELQEGDRIGMMIRSGRTLHYFINGLEQGVASTDVPSPVWSVVDLYGMTVKVTGLLGVYGMTVKVTGLLGVYGMTVKVTGLLGVYGMAVNVTGLLGVYGMTVNVTVTGLSGVYGMTVKVTGLSGVYGMTVNVTGLLGVYGMTVKVTGLLDVYGMTVKVTLMDRDPRDQQNLLMRQIAQAEDQRSAAAASATLAAPPVSGGAETCGSTDLLFSAECGSSAQVINGGMTAHRPNALEDFNHGVVLTSRPLKPGELLEVRLDQCVYMWAGSLEIGVTTHSPHSFEYPSTMTKVTTGTWMMTGDGGVKHNGTTIINEYGLNLDRLQVGDRAGVVRHADGSLHFFINGADQGVAASGVPETVYGVVDLYGQAAQATIVHGGAVGQSGGSEGPGQQVGASPSRVAAANSATAPGTLVSGRSSHQPQARVRPLQQQVQQQQQQQVPSGTTFYSDLRFHELHGRNASVIRNGLGAERPHADAEFNDAIVISNRQLHEGEMFEVMIEKVVDRWSGSLEAGVTAIHPEDIEFPSTMTDIDYDTWMLSGSSVMMNGVTIKNNYACDLDSLGIGSRIGMMRHADATLHYYVNGVDQGVACTNLPAGIWAVVDLYGQCAQVSIVHNPVNCEQLSAAAATRLADSCKRQQQQQQQQQQQKPDSAIKEQNTTLSKPRTGRPRKINDCAARKLVRTVVQRLQTTREELKDDLKASGIEASKHAISRALRCEGLRSRTPHRTPLLQKRRVKARLKYANDHLNKPAAFWNSVCHQFSYCHGTGVTVSEGRGALHRTSRQEGAATGRTQASCLAFTNSPLSSDELFEVRITRLDPELRGSIRIGLTTLPMLPNLSIHSVPPSLSSVHPVPPSDTWWVGESNAYHNFCGWKPPILLPGINGQNGLDDTSGTRPTLCRSSHENVTRSVSFADKCGGNSSRMNTAWTVSIAKHDFCPHLSKLVLGDRIGVKRTSDGCMRLYINGFDCGVAATGIQDSNVVLGVVELHGNCIAVETTSYVQEEVSSIGDKTGPQPSGAGATGVVSQDSLELSAVGLTFATEGSAPGSVQPHASTNADVARLAEPQTGSTNPFSSNCLSGGVLPHDVTGGIRYNTRTAFTFSGRHGKNIVLSADRTIAVRKKGYNHGLTVTARPLPRSTMFTAVLNGVDPSFCGGAMLGLLFLGTALSTDNSSLSNTVLPDDLPIAPHSSLPNDMSRSSLGMPDDSCRSSHFPLLEDVPESALDLLIASNCECVLLCGSNVYRGQSKLCSDYGPDLNSVTPGTTLGLCIDAQARLHLFVNGADCGVAAHNIPPNPYVLLDLYGAANEAHIVNCDDASHSGVAEHALKKKTQHNNNQQQQQQSRRQLQQQLHQHSSADGESFVLSNHDEMNLAISRSMNSSAEHVLNSVPATADRHDEVAVCNKNASQNCCNHSTSCLDHDSADHCKALKSCSLDNSTNCNSAFHAIAVSDVNNESVAALNGTSNVADSGTVNAVGCNSSAGAAIALTHASLSTTRTQQNKVKASVRGGDASGKKCAYQRLCGRFLASLSLPGAYFSCDVLCYCDTCHRARGEEAVYTKGNGVEYHRPLGWCRYGLVSGSSDSVCDSWHMAYCAARPGHVRRMLDKGELLFPGELELGFPRRGGRSKEEEGDGSMINVSPSVAVAAATTLPTTGLLERGCGRSYSGRVLLQVAVKPGAYKKLDCENDAAVGSGVPAPAAGVPTAARSAARSDNKPHTRVQWVTKERGATQLLALLVAVEQVEKT